VPAAALPGSGGIGVQSLTSGQISTGLTLDANSARFLYLTATSSAGNGSAQLNLGPDSGHTTVLNGSSEPTGDISNIGVYVPAGWFVSAAFFNASFRDCHYW
jgi:hypothetical protein